MQYLILGQTYIFPVFICGDLQLKPFQAFTIVIFIYYKPWIAVKIQYCGEGGVNLIHLTILRGLTWTSLACMCTPFSQVSATDWPCTKSWDISLDCHIRKYRCIIRSQIVFLESVTFQFHAPMLSSEVAQSLKSYGNVSDLGVGIALSHRHVGFYW